MLAVSLLTSNSVFALYCDTDTNEAHINAGRAEKSGWIDAVAIGSGDRLGYAFFGSSTLQESPAGFFSVVDAETCDNLSSNDPAPYAEAKPVDIPDLMVLEGRYGVAMAGGHFLEASLADPSGYPRDKVVNSSDTITIPYGATVEYAFLYYGGAFGLAGGDFTPDNLESAEDTARNGIQFRIDNDSRQGPFDPVVNQPVGQTVYGSQALTGAVFEPSYGTLTGTKTTYWSNRLDITNYLRGKSGAVKIAVDAPEELDINVNRDGTKGIDHGGNPAGPTVYNSCFNSANWGLVVIYKDDNETPKQLTLKDGKIIQAWDYEFIHSGEWQRPMVTFYHHAPTREGTRFYVLAQEGKPAGDNLPSSPTCTCGCGGTYDLVNEDPGLIPDTPSNFFTKIHKDPVNVIGDSMHRDSTNGPWKLTSIMGVTQPKHGNDWTLFQNGTRFTEFPNLYEGEETSADGKEPYTAENTPDMDYDVYGGHPWDDRGEVTYHAWGNNLSAVEVAPLASRLEMGATETSFYFKGDQKDVFKPQTKVMVRFLMLSVPLEGSVIEPECMEARSALNTHVNEGRAWSDTQTTGESCFWGFCWGGTTTTTYYAEGSNETLGTSGTSEVILHSSDNQVWYSGSCAD